jgi:hypothetical protein
MKRLVGFKTKNEELPEPVDKDVRKKIVEIYKLIAQKQQSSKLENIDDVDKMVQTSKQFTDIREKFNKIVEDYVNSFHQGESKHLDEVRNSILQFTF